MCSIMLKLLCIYFISFISMQFQPRTVLSCIGVACAFPPHDTFTACMPVPPHDTFTACLPVPPHDTFMACLPNVFMHTPKATQLTGLAQETLWKSDGVLSVRPKS